MVPSTRLLWLTAALFPLAAAAGLSPAFAPAAYAACAAVGIAAMVDALISRSVLDGVRVGAAGTLRLHKDREAMLTLRCEVDAAVPTPVRMGIAWPEGLEAEADEQTVDRARVDWKLTPRKRGDFPIERAHLACPSRWGLWEMRSAKTVGATLRVFPNLQGKDELLAMRRETVGAQTQRYLGRGREFEHLREYVAGDSFDDVDWKATARRGKPVTRIFQVERTQEIYAVVDSSRLPSRLAGAEPRLERYVQSALALGAAAQRQGDRFGLVTFSDKVIKFVRAGTGSGNSVLCREALHNVQPSALAPDFEEVATQLRLHLRGRALLLFLTDLDEPATAEAFRQAARLLGAKHLVAAVTIRPPEAEALFTRRAETMDDVYTQIGGHLRWKALKELELALRRDGVHFRVAEQATLSRQLTRLYGEIKQRQLL